MTLTLTRTLTRDPNPNPNPSPNPNPNPRPEQVTWPFYLRNMMVVGGATAASLCFGNAGYLYLTVSFVQILKAFTPVQP